MLQAIKNVLDSKRIILASASPRRKDILNQVKLNFEVVTSSFEENLNPECYSHPYEFAIDTALHKAKDVLEKTSKDTRKPDLIIAMDTVVVCKGKMYGKPLEPDRAFEMLKQLIGTSHSVHTGVVCLAGEKIIKFHESTEVYMANVSDHVIREYIKTGEPLDKAGGYGIQGIGGSLIEKINGDYYNVVGLPLHRLCQHLLNIYSEH
ncbi:dTTP/UTP pyrophosphatase [Ischnura elegans]|uniref:dTTP/UTP pyrophosphatase n=1 Tax=Ischnura elegans TaxID=197161 RepID=UPI001ED87E53|nr:dTTP/UTP pyrophosphatase [Ischnura elegans]